jgi:hypothetical protein
MKQGGLQSSAVGIAILLVLVGVFAIVVVLFRLA